jgi:hypothetical protein
MTRKVVQAELIERDLTPDVSETMRIFREMRHDGGTSFAHLPLDRLDVLAEALVEADEADLQVRSFFPDDEGPGDDDDDDEDDDLEGMDRSLVEALREAGDDPPWAPVPTRIAKTYLRSNEDAMLELNFPRVYEENRSSMLADLSTAQSLGYIGHERAAIQAASELGFDDYDYDLEQQAIAASSGKIQGMQPGAGDGIAAGVMGQTIPGQKPPPSGTGSDDRGTSIEPRNKRDDLSGDAQHAFRMQQKTSEMVEGAVALIKETLVKLREMSKPVQVPSTIINKQAAPVILQETIQQSVPMRRRVERDEDGLISAIVDEPLETA